MDWTIVIAAYAAGLATAGNLAGLIRWIRAKPQAKKESVKKILKEVRGPIWSLAQGLNSQNPYAAMTTFLESFRPYKDNIVGSLNDLRELAPEIYPDLVGFISIIDSETNGSWKMQTLGIVENDKLKSLAAHLIPAITDWLSKND